MYEYINMLIYYHNIVEQFIERVNQNLQWLTGHGTHLKYPEGSELRAAISFIIKAFVFANLDYSKEEVA